MYMYNMTAKVSNLTHDMLHCRQFVYFWATSIYREFKKRELNFCSFYEAEWIQGTCKEYRMIGLWKASVLYNTWL